MGIIHLATPGTSREHVLRGELLCSGCADALARVSGSTRQIASNLGDGSLDKNPDDDAKARAEAGLLKSVTVTSLATLTLTRLFLQRGIHWRLPSEMDET